MTQPAQRVKQIKRGQTHPLPMKNEAGFRTVGDGSCENSSGSLAAAPRFLLSFT